MNIYRIGNDVDQYQFIIAEKEEDDFKLATSCTSMIENWIPPPVSIYDPNLKPGDFYQFSMDILITNKRATIILKEFLEESGELLQLPHK